MSSGDEGRRADIRALFERASGGLPEEIRKEARDLSRKVATHTSQRRDPRRRTGIQPGSRVADRYVVRREIGRGGVATVYEATDTKFGVQVALKVAAASGEAVKEFRVRFQREARISYLIGKAPGIVRALDWGDIEEGVSLYLVLDLVPGARPLDLKRGPLEARIKRLETATRLLDLVHRQGIVHRDVKPGNFLVNERGHIRLSDFGTAKSTREEAKGREPQLVTRTGVLIGTPQFMAPEQFNDPRHVELTADVYALGVMLYFTLTGSYPYSGESPIEFLSLQLKTRYGLLAPPRSPRDCDPRVSESLSDLCMAAIELDPDLRPQSAGEFLRRLQGAATGKSATTAREPLWSRLGLDADGFVGLEALREIYRRLGADAFLERVGGTPALYAVSERPVKGETHYEGKVAFLLQRATKNSGAPVTLGRTEESDLAVRLVSVSKQHLRFSRQEDTWELSDTGSSNGTHVGEQALTPGDRYLLAPRDRIRLAQHLTLEFLPPLELIKRLQ